MPEQDHGDEVIVVLTEEQARVIGELISPYFLDAQLPPGVNEVADALVARQPAQREWSVVSATGERWSCKDRAEAEDTDWRRRCVDGARVESRIVGPWEPVEEARDRG